MRSIRYLSLSLGIVVVILIVAACGGAGGNTGVTVGGPDAPTSIPVVPTGTPTTRPTPRPTGTVDFNNGNWGLAGEYADDYKGSPVDITGQVFNIVGDQNGKFVFQVFVESGGKKWNTRVEVPQHVEMKTGDNAHVTGKLQGMYSTTAVSGQPLTLPLVTADEVKVLNRKTPGPTFTPTTQPAPSPSAATPTATRVVTPPPSPTQKPAATATPVPPTATPTQASPTATAVPPSPTVPSTNTPAPQANGAQVSIDPNTTNVNAPMTLNAGDTASGGDYLVTSSTDQSWDGTGTPPGDAGSASVDIQIPEDGTYAIWTHMWYAGSDGNSYWLKIDESPAIKVGNEDSGYQIWKWVGWHDGSPSNGMAVKLTAGQHTFQIIGREAGARIGQIIVTNDLTYIPH